MSALVVGQRAQKPEPTRFVAHKDPEFSQGREGIELRAGPGWLRTDRIFEDLRMRFEFRVMERESHAVLAMRTEFQSTADTVDRGYLVHLSGQGSGDEALGRVTALNRPFTELKFTPVVLPEPLDPNAWHIVEMAIAGRTLAVRVDGADTFRANGLEAAVGYVGFQTTRGHIQIRKIVLEEIPVKDDSFAAGAARTTDPGVEVPQVIKEVRPAYTPEAMKRRVEGIVLLDVIIQPDGSVGKVRVKKPLHPDLDHAAIVAARQWRFTPPLKDGVPVAMLVDLSLSFTIFVRQ